MAGLRRATRARVARTDLVTYAAMRMFAAHPQLETTRVEPRYWPWASVIARVPGMREVLMWNCVIRFERR